MGMPYSFRPQLGGLVSWLFSGFKGKPSVGISVTIPLAVASIPLPEQKPMSFAAIVTLLQGVNALLPEVITLLSVLESAFPNASVDAKLEEVIKAVKAFETVEGELTSPISVITSLIKGLGGVAAKPAA